MKVRLRKFPFPFRAMLAISTDIDHTTPAIFRETHRFMNTEEVIWGGRGVGLDVANSFWFYHAATEPEIRLFEDEISCETTPEAEELVAYLRCGWIDTMHSYGNFWRALRGEVRFMRAHALRVLEILQDLDIKVRVWTNHGGAGNLQNFGRVGYMQGDSPESHAYHTDLLLEYGVQFAWNHQRQSVFGHESMLEPLELEDGQTMWGFSRYFQEIDPSPMAFEVGEKSRARTGALQDGRRWIFVWYPSLLPYQLSEEKLEHLIAESQYSIVAQHLGSIARPVGSQTRYEDSTIETFRRLADYQRRGLILIASTSRLLEYNRAAEYALFEEFTEDGTDGVRISKIADPIFGDFTPTLDQVRGLTFEVGDSGRTRLFLGPAAVPESELERVSTPEGDFVMIKWHERDITDYTEEWDRIRQPLPTRGVTPIEPKAMYRFDAERATEQVLRLLEEMDSPPEIDAKAFQIAVDYARKRHRTGLAHYIDAVRKIGFTGRERAIDVGSGAGHWTIALALENKEAHGIDLRGEYVEIARRIAALLELEQRISYAVGRAEEASYPDDSFELACCHSVLMYLDHELMLRNIGHWLQEGGLLYLAYTTIGARLRAVDLAIPAQNWSTIENNVGALLGQELYRCGLSRPRGPRTRTMDPDELAALAEKIGFEERGNPGIEDKLPDFAAFPSTVDFLFEKTSTDPEKKRMSSGNFRVSWVEDLRELVAQGLPRTALQLIEEDGSPLRSRRLAEVRARALVKAGMQGEVLREAFRTLEDVGPEYALTRGLLLHADSAFEDALAEYAQSSDEHSERPFLEAACLLSLERYEEAADRFAEELGRRRWIGQMAAAVGRRDLPELERLLAELTSEPVGQATRAE